MPDINFASIKVNGDDKSIFVATNIKHDQLTNFVSRRKCAAQIIKTDEISLLHDFEPTR
jgi:hypothetical protein